MTTLTITLGTVAVIWASQTFGLYQGNAGNYYNSRAAALKETLAIEDVWLYNATTSTCSTQGGTSNACLNVTIRNTGTIEVKIVAIYVKGATKTYISPSSLPVTITVGAAQTFMIRYATPTGWPWGAYYIQVATARGNQVSIYWSYP
jgi:hypothetical protein